LPRGQHLRQAHELDELEKAVGRVQEAHAAAVPERRELEARERVDDHCVELDAVHVTHHDRATRVEERTRTVAQAREVCAGDRSADG
jgi:hypothetical protein